MKRRKLPTYKIFSFDDLDENHLYKTHVELISDVIPTGELNSMVNNVLEQYTLGRKQRLNKHIPRQKELMAKYQFLIHLLITKSYFKCYVEIPSSLYQDFFGNEYSDMFKTLAHLGYIFRSRYYKKGGSIRRIELLKYNIKCRQKYDHSFEKYNKKYLGYNKRQKNSRLKCMNSRYGDEFVRSYSNNLAQLRLMDETGARKLIDENQLTSEYSKQKNHYVIDRYLDKKFSIGYDQNNRLYTILTNTNKDLKPYLNIKYQVDISNCNQQINLPIFSQTGFLIFSQLSVPSGC